MGEKEESGVEKINVVLVNCKRCGHKWVPRVPVVRICPKCKSPYWNVEKTRFFNGNSRNHNNNNNSHNNSNPSDLEENEARKEENGENNI